MGEDLPASWAEAKTDLEPEFTHDELRAAIFAEMAALAEQVRNPRPGEEWVTVKEYAAHHGFSEDRARDDLYALVNAGKAMKQKVKLSWYFRLKASE